MTGSAILNAMNFERDVVELGTYQGINMIIFKVFSKRYFMHVQYVWKGMWTNEWPRASNQQGQANVYSQWFLNLHVPS